MGVREASTFRKCRLRIAAREKKTPLPETARKEVGKIVQNIIQTGREGPIVEFSRGGIFVQLEREENLTDCSMEILEEILPW